MWTSESCISKNIYQYILVAKIATKHLECDLIVKTGD